MLKGVACGNGKGRTIMASQSENARKKRAKNFFTTHAKTVNGGNIYAQRKH